MSLTSPDKRRVVKRKGKEKRRTTNIKDAIAQTWYRREMETITNSGLPVYLQQKGSTAEESVDMNVEYEGPFMDYMRILSKARKAFSTGFGMHITAERMTKILKEKATDRWSRNPDAKDQVLEFTASLLDAMPEVSDNHRAQLKAYILTEVLPIAS